MRFRSARQRVLVAAFAVAVAVLASPSVSDARACAFPASQATWIDYGDIFVPFAPRLFGKPGLTVAVSKTRTAAQMRARGAATVYWDMYLNKRVGTPSAPADAGTVDGRADRLYAHAVAVTACARPVIALNELFGSHLATPWSPTNRVYRANVLALVRRLAARGARPVLLISRAPATGGAARAWWRDVAAAADIAREVYVPAPRLYANGPVAAARTYRASLRRAVAELTGAGVPAARVGIVLGFHAGTGGREVLQPASAWLDVVQLETAALRDLAPELGISTVWSWGWGRWNADPDQERAACVYLWTRNPSLCDAAGMVGTLATTAAVTAKTRPRTRLSILWKVRRVVAVRITASEALEGTLATVQRRRGSGRWVSLKKVFLKTAAPTTVRLVLPRGRSALRVVVSARQDVLSATELVSAR